MRRLEIGGGPHPVEGYEQLNGGWGFQALPYPNETFEEFYSSHAIEHLPWWLTRPALAEAFRILKSGGIIEIHTVNFAYLVSCYLKGEVGDKWAARGKNPEMHPFRWVASRIFSVGPEDNWHRAIFDYNYLHELLTEAGFVDLELSKYPKGPMKHGPMNIGIKGVKPCM